MNEHSDIATECIEITSQIASNYRLAISYYADALHCIADGTRDIGCREALFPIINEMRRTANGERTSTKSTRIEEYVDPTWPLVVAPETVKCEADIPESTRRPCFMLIQANKTLAILAEDRRNDYGIDLERAGEKAKFPGRASESDWLAHIVHKECATKHMLRRLPAACRQALAIVGFHEHISLFSDYDKDVIDEAPTTERN